MNTKDRAIALSNIFSQTLDKRIMSLESEYIMTSELQFSFKEHFSSIMCSTLPVETGEYYVFNNSTVYVLLIDASKAFDRLCHSKLFEVLETYNVCPLVRRLLYNIYSRSEMHVQWKSTQFMTCSLYNGVKQGGGCSPILISIYIDSLLQKLEDPGLRYHVGRTGEFTGEFGYADYRCGLFCLSFCLSVDMLMVFTTTYENMSEMNCVMAKEGSKRHGLHVVELSQCSGKPLCKLSRHLPPRHWGPIYLLCAGPAGWLALLHIKARDVETNRCPTTTRRQVWICDICHRQIYGRKQISIRCNRI